MASQKYYMIHLSEIMRLFSLLVPSVQSILLGLGPRHYVGRCLSPSPLGQGSKAHVISVQETSVENLSPAMG
jgi:hypothetical protein